MFLYILAVIVYWIIRTCFSGFPAAQWHYPRDLWEWPSRLNLLTYVRVKIYREYTDWNNDISCFTWLWSNIFIFVIIIPLDPICLIILWMTREQNDTDVPPDVPRLTGADLEVVVNADNAARIPVATPVPPGHEGRPEILRAPPVQPGQEASTVPVARIPGQLRVRF